MPELFTKEDLKIDIEKVPISEVFNGDCMNFMAKFPDKFFELAIVDPPYGIGDWTTQAAVYVDRFGNKKIKKSEKMKPVTWNNSIPKNDYFIELNRVSSKTIIWGANYYNSFEGGGAVIWYKGKGNPVFSSCEIASISHQKRVDYCHIDWQSGFSRQKKEDVIHQCQKPVALYMWLLRNYAKEGDKILDTHMGSQSSRIACYKLGFDYYGSELDEDYFKAGCTRFEKEIKFTKFKII